MEELFSCRNCIHNCGQSLLIGRGSGFCVKHDSVIPSPDRTTCKYLHRKDLPRFVVDEGLREHAGEFAGFSGMADLVKRAPVERLQYSERFVWEHNQYDPITQGLAQYHKAKSSWIFLQAMSGGIDGRRSLTHASLVRRYMDNCGTWKSSYRFVLAVVKDLANSPQFQSSDLVTYENISEDELREDAVWDVFFTKLSGVQEYGFHSGIEKLMWCTDQLNGSLTALDWEGLGRELEIKVPEWLELIIKRATDEGEFFSQTADFGSQPESEVY